MSASNRDPELETAAGILTTRSLAPEEQETIANLLLGAASRIEVLERAINAALDELGVPGSDTPAPVGNAVELLAAVVPRAQTLVPTKVDAKAQTPEERHG